MRAALALLLLVLVSQAGAEDLRLSGRSFMGKELQGMQDDDSANPAQLAVLDGAELWRDRSVKSGKSCADCHEVGSLADVALRYPVFDKAQGRPLSLGRRILLCRAAQQDGRSDWSPESPPLLAVEAYLGLQSRGQPIPAVSDDDLLVWVKRGEQLFYRRAGQLDLSCADCHETHAGFHLGGSTIPQAHPTGYPIYRLEWQSMGSLERRLRNCLSGMRAIVPPFDADPLLALTLFLKQRAAGMVSETPALRP